MKIEIIGGKDQIGGNVIELSTDTTRILLDIGSELDDDKDKNKAKLEIIAKRHYDAVFVTHYHGDHLGLAYYIDEQIPLYMGEKSYEIVKSANEYCGRKTFIPSGFISNKKLVQVGDIKVTTFLCDHSAFDSYMLLCEGDGEKVLYTGDFRSNGRKSFDVLLNQLPTNIDTLICEGTTLSRGNYIPKTEKELEEEATTYFKETTGPVFVLQASTNIDRIVTMYKAAKHSKRIFLEDVYMVGITSAIGDRIPNPNTFYDVKTFITTGSKHEALLKYKNIIGKDGIKNIRFVMCIRTSMLRYIEKLSNLMSFENGVLVYSLWSGYKEKPEMIKFLSKCEEMGLKIIDLHTTGHADYSTIDKLVKTTNPRQIISVHTENGAWFDRYLTDKRNDKYESDS